MTAVAPALPVAPLLLDLPGAWAAVSRRTPGVGTGSASLRVRGSEPDVLGVRHAVAAAVGLAPGDLVWAEQVHGGAVALVGRADRGRGARDHAEAVRGLDGLVTCDAGVGVGVLAADCVPLALAAGSAVAAVHAGRRGVVAGVVAAAVEVLRSASGDAAVHAVIGPAIGGCCYEVPDALAAEVSALEPAAAARTTWGTSSLDLPAAVAAQLERAGAAHVVAVGGCTRCGDGAWFSARREGESGRPDGRHALVITPSAPVAPQRSAAVAFVD